MKPVQVMFDDDLLRRLSESDEVRDRGRSEVVRRAVDVYLTHRERERIAHQYRTAYSTTDTLEDELDGWAGEGTWPDE
ncbi:MAG: ribbon-helix-helix protein, CopG family [Spirochaetaceae bacterium]|nr:MAG: ribbon-helix-helix protein, CopG family [Spirochaetaceae bacterium]